MVADIAAKILLPMVSLFQCVVNSSNAHKTPPTGHLHTKALSLSANKGKGKKSLPHIVKIKSSNFPMHHSTNISFH